MNASILSEKRRHSVSEYEMGKDLGNLLARVTNLEKKVGCGCGGAPAAKTIEIEYTGLAKETSEKATGQLHKDLTAHFATCPVSGHLRSTTTPPQGQPSGPHYCQICCIGAGDDGWFYCTDAQGVYVTRERGNSASVTCGGVTRLCSC